MIARARGLLLFALVAAVTWGCGGEQVTTSQVPERDVRNGRPIICGRAQPALTVRCG